MDEIGMNETTIKEKNNATKNTIKTKTKEHFKNKMKIEGKNKSKINYLKQGIGTWEAGRRRDYMKKLTRQKTSLPSQARTRMLKIQNNYRNKYNNHDCRACGHTSETQDHILNECTKLHTSEVTKVQK